MKEGRTTQVSIRLTQEERERIREHAERVHLKEAAYVRNRALGEWEIFMPEETEHLLRQFLEINLSAGRDINQAARCCRENGSFSADHYRELTDALEQMNRSYETLNDRILEVINRHGDHETAPSEREQKRKSGAAPD